MILYDTHMHTDYSPDSETPVQAQIARALELGLKGVCITDHMDIGFPPDQFPWEDENPFMFDVDDYFEKLGNIRKNNPDIFIGIGIECGLQSDDDIVNKNRKIITSHNFDQVIGSIHLIDKKDPYYDAFWEGKDHEKIIKRYFEITYENLNAFDDIDILGHMDYAVRYLPKGCVYDPNKYMDIIDEILNLIIKKDIALEINTQGLKKGYGLTNPHPDIIKRYKALGGKLISLGADAHSPDVIAYGFDQVEKSLAEMGFDSYASFSERKIILHHFSCRQG